MNMSQVTNDILTQERFAGAIYTISGLTDIVDKFFIMAISAVAFLIIMVAMFKNVLAGAYCAYPKFWDRVHNEHEQNAGVGWMQRIQQNFNPQAMQQMNERTLGGLVMGIIPDIKAMTDFEGDTLSAKQYFTRAIPMMLVCVIIGAFIYNGYYRDVAALVVDTGSTLIERTLFEFDPIAMWDQFAGTASRPTFLLEDAPDGKGRNLYKIASSYYSAVIGTYTDMTSAGQKTALARACEAKADEVYNGMAAAGDLAEGDGATMETLWDDVNYKMSITMDWSKEAIDVSGRSGWTTDKHTYMYGVCWPVSELNVATLMEVENAQYIVAVFKFSKRNVQDGQGAITDLVLCGNSGTIPKYDSSSTSMGLTNPTATKTFQLTGEGGGTATLTVEPEQTGTGANTTVTGYKYTIGNIQGASGSVRWTIQGSLTIRDPVTRMSHQIKYVGGSGSGLQTSDGSQSFGWEAGKIGVTAAGAAGQQQQQQPTPPT